MPEAATRQIRWGWAALFVIVALAAPVAAAEPEQVGLWNPQNGRWHIGGERFYFGNPGDVPLMGDWDCDGVDTVGMFRPGNGFVYLSNVNAFGKGEISFFYGQSGDVPLVGDWDADGCDSIGVFRNGEVLLRNELSSGPADVRFFFGSAGDRPFTGDFDGDGRSSLGLHRPSAGKAYLRNALTTGPADHEFFYGEPSDWIVAGDWDGDGDDSVGLFRSKEGRFHLSYESPADGIDEVRFVGNVSWVPINGVLVAPPPPPPPPDTGPILYRVNAGGPALAALDGGLAWSADNAATPSKWSNAEAALSLTAAWPVTNTDATVGSSVPGAVFRSERWDPRAGQPMQWTFPIETGTTVQVNVFFSSGFAGASASGQRQFSMSTSQGPVIRSLDVAAEAGHGIGTRRTFYAKVQDGTLRIGFGHQRHNPQVNAIEIIRLDTDSIDFERLGDSPVTNGDLLRHTLAHGRLAEVRIGPGEFAVAQGGYLVPVNTSLVGAGPSATTLRTSAGPAVRVGNGSSLSGLTIAADFVGGAGLEAVGKSSFQNLVVDVTASSSAVGIRNVAGRSSFQQIQVSVAANDSAGFEVTSGRPALNNSSLVMSGQSVIGIRTQDSAVDLDTVAVELIGSGGGVEAHGSTVNASGMTLELGEGSVSTGVRLEDSVMTASTSRITVSANESARGFVVTRSELDLTGSEVEVTSPATAGLATLTEGRATIGGSELTATGIDPRGAVATSSELTLRNTAMNLIGSLAGTLIENQGSVITVVGSSLGVESGGTATGIDNTTDGFRRNPDQPGRVTVSGSTLVAKTHMVINLAEVTTTLADSVLAGGSIIDPAKAVRCTNVRDEVGVVYATECPDLVSEPS